MTKRLLKISKYKPSIFQGRFEFNSGGAVSLSLEHPYEQLLLRILAAMLIALVAGYLYFVSASILNVMAQREALKEISDIQGTIGSSQQQYFALSQQVTPNKGQALGLSPIKQTSYVYRPGTVGSVGAATIARNAI